MRPTRRRPRLTPAPSSLCFCLSPSSSFSSTAVGYNTSCHTTSTSCPSACPSVSLLSSFVPQHRNNAIQRPDYPQHLFGGFSFITASSLLSSSTTSTVVETEEQERNSRFARRTNNNVKSSSTAYSYETTPRTKPNQTKNARSPRRRERQSYSQNKGGQAVSTTQSTDQSQIANKSDAKKQTRLTGTATNGQKQTTDVAEDIVHTLLHCLFRGKRAEREEMLAQLRSGQIAMTVEQLIDVISALNRSKRIQMAMRMLEMVESGPLATSLASSASVRSYTIMIDTYGKAFQLSKSFSLFYGMGRNGVRPDAVTYNALIAACARNDEPDLAFEVYEEMKHAGFYADKFTFDALIASFARSGHVDRAFELSAMMSAAGITKDQITYSSLLNSCAKAGQSVRSLMVFEEMKHKGVWPTLLTFSVLIDSCANTKQPERAFQIFSELKHWGLGPPNAAVFTSMIAACSKCGWPERGELVLDAMIQQAVEPNQFVFGILVEGWAKQGRLDRAFNILDRMVKQHNLHPNALLIGGLTDSCRKLRETGLVEKIWNFIVDYNLRPSRIYYPCLIVMAIMDGNVRLATVIVLHAYARGCFRRASLHSEDPSLHAIACAIVFYRHEVVKKAEEVTQDEDTDQNSYSVAAKNANIVFKSLAMSGEEMDSMPATEARELCLTWGDFETIESRAYQRRHGSRRERRALSRKDPRFSAALRKVKHAAAPNEVNVSSAL